MIAEKMIEQSKLIESAGKAAKDAKDLGEDVPGDFLRCDISMCQKWRFMPMVVFEELKKEVVFTCKDVYRLCTEKCDGECKMGGKSNGMPTKCRCT
jgi:hypothetical protein